MMVCEILHFDSSSQILSEFKDVLELSKVTIVNSKESGFNEKILDSGSLLGVLYSGDCQDEMFLSFQELSRKYPNITFVALVTDDRKIEVRLQQLSGITIVSPEISKEDFVGLFLKATKVSISPRQVEEKKYQNNTTDFFNTLELNQVLEIALRHFGDKILCKNIHWIDWKELQHLKSVDGDSLNLEIEAKYHKTPKIKSQRDSSVKNVANLVRAFPLMAKMQSLEGNGYIVQKTNGNQHLLFPIRDSKNKRNLACLLVENLHNGEPKYIVDFMRETILFMVRHIEFAYELWEAKNLSFSDDLTELYNQRYLPLVLDTEIARSNRSGTKFSILFFDIDHFKKVNDLNGHLIGSKLLIEIGRLVKNSIRSCDYGFRYGGDEYVILLVDTDVDGATVVAERLRKKVENSQFIIDGQAVNLTVSIGVACFPDHAQTQKQIIQMADEAMYLGKHKGRNITHVAS